MTYTINKSDGTRLVDILDGTIDQTTDLNLIGKNSTTFGQVLNENLVYLLENFSNSTPPTKPIVGQIWYNTTESRLQVYTGSINSWRPAGSPIISQNKPENLVKGDFWINDVDKQLYFYDGTTLTLAGQPWTTSQGITGLVAKTVYDDSNNFRSILQLFVKDTLLGIYSSDAFTLNPTNAISGFSQIVQGYNSNSNLSSTFGITSQNSLKLNGLTSNSFLRSDVTPDPITQIPNTRSVMSVPLSITSADGISFGPRSSIDIKTNGGLGLFIENKLSGGDIALRVTNQAGVTSSKVYVNSDKGFVGIGTEQPQKELDINGAVIIRGTLEVNGKILTVPIELTLIDNDILGYAPVTIACTGSNGASTLSMSSTTGIHAGMEITGSAGLGDNVKVLEVGASQVTITVPNDGAVSGSLTFTDTQTVKDKTTLILTDIAPPAFYLTNQVALVHYQHINFSTQLITRYLKKYVISSTINNDNTINEFWQFDSNLASSI